MTSLRRMLDVLTLLTPEQPQVGVDEICRQLGYPPATAYRYVRELAEFGLLVRLPGGYALGPRIIQMDLQMRESDPLLAAARDLMQQLARETGLNVLLSELYEDTVINTHQEFGLDASALNFGRGRPMALFRSATARVILAHLPPRQLRRVYDASAAAPDVQRLGADWRAFSRAMLSLRKAGYCLSHGELDADKSGLAAPIFDEKQRVLGSLTLVGTTRRFEAFNETYLSGRIVEAAGEISRRMAAGPDQSRSGELAPPARRRTD